MRLRIDTQLTGIWCLYWCIIRKISCVSFGCVCQWEKYKQFLSSVDVWQVNKEYAKKWTMHNTYTRARTQAYRNDLFIASYQWYKHRIISRMNVSKFMLQCSSIFNARNSLFFLERIIFLEFPFSQSLCPSVLTITSFSYYYCCNYEKWQHIIKNRLFERITRYIHLKRTRLFTLKLTKI